MVVLPVNRTSYLKTEFKFGFAVVNLVGVHAEVRFKSLKKGRFLVLKLPKI